MQSQQNVPPHTIADVLLNGNIPVAGPGRTGMMAGAGGIIPPALLDESRVPRFYQEAIAACGATQTSMLPHTALVYNMMVTSGLPRPVLSYIWSAVNRTLPGQLTRAEFFSCLALIALTQKGESLAALSTLSQLPIPFLQPVQVPVQQPPVVVVSGQQQPAAAPASRPKKEKSSFIPISLLRRRPAEAKKEASVGEPQKTQPDLLSPTTTSSSSSSASTSSTSATSDSSSTTTVAEAPATGPNYDLTGIDWSNVGSSFNNSTNSSSGSLAALAEPERKTSSSGDSPQVIWMEAIKAAAGLFKECEALLKGSPDAVLKETFETERGVMYLKNLHSLNVVVDRVVLAAGSGMTKELAAEVAVCRAVWQRFGRFLAANEKDPVEEDGISNAVCPVCHSAIACSSVEFAGRCYHSECANLWVNCVRPVLPC